MGIEAGDRQVLPERPVGNRITGGGQAVNELGGGHQNRFQRSAVEAKIAPSIAFNAFNGHHDGSGNREFGQSAVRSVHLLQETFHHSIFARYPQGLDNATHSLVGLFLARSGFRRVTPLGTAVLVVAANAPDFDVISWFWGRPTWLHWHRNITHALIAMPAMALLSVAAVALFGKGKVRWWPAFLIAIIGVASHILLDLTNIYGVRLALPFSGHWWHMDSTPVVDYVIWAILFIGVAAPALSRLVGSEIGERDPHRGKAGWAVTALLLLAAWDYTRGIFHDKAVSVVASHHYARLTPRSASAFPSQNLLVWRGIAEMSFGYADVPVDLRGAFRPADAALYYKPPQSSAMRAASGTFPFQMLHEFVQYPLWVQEPALDGAGNTRIALIDLRFGTPSNAGFAATAIVSPDNRVVDSIFGLGEVRPR